MIRRISRDLIRMYLDEMGVTTRIDEEGDLVTVLKADDDFSHDVVIFYMVRGGWLHVEGQAVDYNVDEKERIRVLEALNEHNGSHTMSFGFLYKGLIKFKHSLLIDEEVSEAYLKKNGLRLGIYTIWRSFVELDQQLRSTEVPKLDIDLKSTVGLN